MQLVRPEIDNIPKKWLEVIAHFLMGFRNDTVDFRKPYLRPSVQNLYPLFIAVYAALSVCGTIANIAMIVSVLRRGLHKQDPRFCFLLNLALSHLAMCVFVLPVSLAVLLIQNWIFGATMCFCLPMLQDIPLHVSMLNLVLLAADRHRQILYPMRSRLPGLACCISAWLAALVVVLPYPVYTTYLDLGALIKGQFDGVGICAVNLADDMQEYTRGLFIIMYVLPLAVTAFLHVRIARELKVQGAAGMANTALHDTNGHGMASAMFRARSGSRCEQCEDTELDIPMEQRTQKFLIAITVIFALCMCPLTVLRMIRLVLIETYENSGHFDIIFTLLVWIAFLPTCTTPILFSIYLGGRPAKNKLCRICCLRHASPLDARSTSTSYVHDEALTINTYQPEYTST